MLEHPYSYRRLNAQSRTNHRVELLRRNGDETLGIHVILS